MSADRYALVIGGGVIGVCCAYFLAKRGAEVAVLERDQIGRGASYGNAGCIAPGHPPINRPGRIGQAVRSLFHAYTVPRADHTMVSWLRSFSRTCNQDHLKRAMRVLSPLGHATRELFDDLVAKEKIECCFRRNGYYEIYLTESGFEAAKREADFLRAYGFHPEPVSTNSLWQRDPAISDRVVGGVFYPEAETLIPYQFVTELARRAESHGAEFLTNTEAVSVRIADGRVQGVLTRSGEFIESDTVILACGAYSARLVRQLGLPFLFAGHQGLSPRLQARHRQAAPAPVSLHTGRANGVLYYHERVCAFRGDA